MYKYKTIIPLIILALLSGCSHMNSTFDCPMREGLRCQSLDQVNVAVDRGEIGASPIGETIQGMPVSQSYKGSGDLIVTKSQEVPVRDPENVIQIWIAPYEDTHGNYHQASSVFAVSNPGRWLNYPAKEIKEDDYV